MTEPTLFDFAISLFVLSIIFGVPVAVYGIFELWAKSRQAAKEAQRQLPVIKTVRRSY